MAEFGLITALLTFFFTIQRITFLFSYNRKTNIFDSMMYMMENYANNLEDIVTEKTGQLREAKRETEELLYKILPRYYIIQKKQRWYIEIPEF